MESVWTETDFLCKIWIKAATEICGIQSRRFESVWILRNRGRLVRVEDHGVKTTHKSKKNLIRIKDILLNEVARGTMRNEGEIWTNRERLPDRYQWKVQRGNTWSCTYSECPGPCYESWRRKQHAGEQTGVRSNRSTPYTTHIITWMQQEMRDLKQKNCCFENHLSSAEQRDKVKTKAEFHITLSHITLSHITLSHITLSHW